MIYQLSVITLRCDALYLICVVGKLAKQFTSFGRLAELTLWEIRDNKLITSP